MGTLLCFELACALRRTGQVPGPVHLFVSGHRAPHLPDPRPPMHHLPDLQFVAELRRLNGTPERVLQNEELLQLCLTFLRADFVLCETYRYKEEQPLTCPISSFGGLQDQNVLDTSICAWGEHTSSIFTARFFPFFCI